MEYTDRLYSSWLQTLVFIWLYYTNVGFFFQTELYWSSLVECPSTTVGGATGQAAWRAWRTRALATQLPKQDLSLAHCRHVDEGHHKQYEDFVAARNEIALDIGKALKLNIAPSAVEQL